jgi:ATP-dependent DNA helicase RecG
MLNDVATISGTVLQIKSVFTKGYKKITYITVADETGSVTCIFFNQLFLSKTIKNGDAINISGKIERYDNKISFVSPEYEIKTSVSPCLNTGRIVPIYPETAKISSKWIRKRIFGILESNNLKDLELIPLNILERYKFPKLDKALKDIHFPNRISDSENARRRFGYEELFTNQLLGLIKKKEWGQRTLAKKITLSGNELLDFISSLPFTLTTSQLKVCKELLEDLQKDTPANRLLQGDVGSGKTVVVALAMFATIKAGASCVLMAPTEVLAKQHQQTLKNIFCDIVPNLKINLVTGSRKEDDTSLKPQIIVGTHALLFKSTKFRNIGIVIIDEQHKFGVEQREKILSLVSEKNTPHMITMTATPIPRSLCLTLFGDLDISSITELPRGRIATKTFITPNEKRDSCYNWIKNKIKKENEQVFVVCPFIEESAIETLKTIKATTTHYEQLRNNWFNDIPIGMLHGRINYKEKEKIINDFKEGNIKILVTTPVVEVGIDIPNANIIIIEGAERFGLASIHQLRGRVGRGGKQGYCFLFATSDNTHNKNLKIVEKISDGLVLAQKDLENRGPGEFYGIKQSGKIKYRFADFKNISMLENSYNDAKSVVDNSKNYKITFDMLNKVYPHKSVKN